MCFLIRYKGALKGYIYTAKGIFIRPKGIIILLKVYISRES